MAPPQACLGSYNRSSLTCKESAPKWKASGVCKLSKKVLPSVTFGSGMLLVFACLYLTRWQNWLPRVSDTHCLQKGGAGVRRDRCTAYGSRQAHRTPAQVLPLQSV